MKRLYYIPAKVVVEVTLHILAESTEEAMLNAIDGAWANVVPCKNWDKSSFIEPLGEVLTGPRVNS